MWFDTYDFARRVEYFGIGRIGNYKNAPKCASGELGSILKDVILGKKAKAIRDAANAMAKACSGTASGCEVAARGIFGCIAGIET